MKAKTVACQTLAIGPMLLLSAIAIGSRAEPTEPGNPEFGRVYHERIRAYALPVREVARLTALEPASRSAQVEKVALVWTDKAERGVLKPIPPVDFERFPQVAVHNEIRDAKQSLVHYLWHAAAGVPGAWAKARLLVLAMKVANIGKYSDLPTVQEFSLMQATTLHDLAPLLPRLSDGERSQTLSELQPCWPGREELRVLVRYMRDLHFASLARHGLKGCLPSLRKDYSELDQAITQEAGDPLPRLRLITSEHRANQDFTSVSTSARMALSAERVLNDELAVLCGPQSVR